MGMQVKSGMDWAYDPHRKIEKITQVIERTVRGIEYDVRARDATGVELVVWRTFVLFGRGRFGAGGPAFVETAREQDKFAAEMARKLCRL